MVNPQDRMSIHSPPNLDMQMPRGESKPLAIHNTANMSPTDLGTMAKLSNLNEKQVINLIEDLKLQHIEKKLDNFIQVIKEDTQGIRGFFRYLFSPSAKAEK